MVQWGLDPQFSTNHIRQHGPDVTLTAVEALRVNLLTKISD